MEAEKAQSFVVIGGGPAGLTAAYELLRHDVKPTVLEKDDIVGGIARTEQYKGYHFDMGGHRFFTKSDEVNRMWQEVLADDFLKRPRLSRIFYKSKFFNYPLKPINALLGLGFVESVLIMCSYVRWRLFPYKQEDTFEQWVTNRFGKRLFLTFFKTYTEKVWGISCSELKGEWAAQRIKDLSLKTALLSMFIRPKNTVKTLIESFDYPRQGPGMLWRAVADAIDQQGGQVRMNSGVNAIHREGQRIAAVSVGNNGSTQTITGSHFISSMPVTEFIKKLDPPPPAEVLEAAGKLKYRDFLTVCVIVNQKELFPDNWIYIHEPHVHVGRIQNFKNWSPDMVPDQNKTSLGLEYFCNEGDELWTMSDEDLIELASRELEKIGLADYDAVEDGCVFRVPKSYPVYDSDYMTYLGIVRQYMDSLSNCKTIGRNGLHRYNNQDHSMLTGMYAVRNMLFGQVNNLWDVNADKQYHEEIREDDADAVARNLEKNIPLIFGKLDGIATAAATGVICSAAIFLMTVALVVKGGEVVGPNLALLSNFFGGYEVTWKGSFIGAGYGLLYGGVIGFAFATLRNFVMFLYWALIRHRAERQCLSRLMEFI